LTTLPPQTALGKAIGYSLRQWPKLIRLYLRWGNLVSTTIEQKEPSNPSFMAAKTGCFSKTPLAGKQSASATAFFFLQASSKRPNQRHHALSTT